MLAFSRATYRKVERERGGEVMERGREGRREGGREMHFIHCGYGFFDLGTVMSFPPFPSGETPYMHHIHVHVHPCASLLVYVHVHVHVYVLACYQPDWAYSMSLRRLHLMAVISS